MDTVLNHKAKITIIAVSIVTTLVLLAPCAVVACLGWKAVIPVVTLAAMTGLLSAATGGWRLSLGLAIPFGVSVMVAVHWGNQAWVAAVLLFMLAGTRGLLSVKGWSSASTMLPLSLGFLIAQPPDVQTLAHSVPLTGVVAILGVLWGTGISRLFTKNAPAPKFTPEPLRLSVFYGLILGLLTGAAAWCVVHFQLGHAGGWIILTIVIVMQPYLSDTLTKGFNRAVGTILGFGIAMVIGALTANVPVLYAIAEIAFMLALYAMLSGKKYWHFVTWLTVGIVLLQGASTSVERTAEYRLAATVVAGAAVFAVLGLLYPFVSAWAKRNNVTHF